MGISPKQFEELQKRMNRTGSYALGENPRHSILLGVDPSLRGTGYGVIQVSDSRQMKLLTAGTVKCSPELLHSTCFVKIARTLRDVIEMYHPTVCVVEGLFFVHNLKTAIVMGEARGAALLVAAEHGLDIYEMAPRRVKQAIVGYGGAQKLAVAKMVQRMLKLDEVPEPDAADALALAITYSEESGKPTLRPLEKI